MPGLITQTHNEIVDAEKLRQLQRTAALLGTAVVKQLTVPGETSLERKTRVESGNIPVVVSVTSENSGAMQQFNETLQQIQTEEAAREPELTHAA